MRNLSERFLGKDIELQDTNGRPAGSIKFDKFTIIEKPSFVEYLRSGWFINMSVAIDFTASNGEPSDPNSLHRIDLTGQQLN